MAVLINTDGTEFEVQPANGENFTLQEMYDMIGCSLVQMIYLADGNIMWLDEEGKFKDPVIRNDRATTLLEEAGGGYGDFIAGKALVCKDSEVR